MESLDEAISFDMRPPALLCFCKIKSSDQAFSEESVPKIIFLFLNHTNVVGTQKNPLNETVLLSTQNIC